MKSIYLIQEEGCLNPVSGAFQHIFMGVNELSKHFNVFTYKSSKPFNINNVQKIHSNSENDYVTTRGGILYGTLKDIYIFFRNLSSVPRLIKLFKIENVDFIYERASYLNFSALIACRYLGIPHFYESNGLQFESRKKYYKSFFNTLAKRLEKISYGLSSYTFFIGTYGDYWKIKKNNWSNVENGIEPDLVEKIKSTTKEIFDVCFVGRYMSHQRLDVLVDSFNDIKNKDLIRVNLIGTGLEMVQKKLIEKNINVVNHGFIERRNLINLVSNFEIAVIPGSPQYQSCMKLFDYGAAGCAVLAPKTYNLTYWFSDELFFFDGTANDLKNKLNILISDRVLIQEYSSKLNYKIKSRFTWTKIFNFKSNIIKGITA